MISFLRKIRKSLIQSGSASKPAHVPSPKVTVVGERTGRYLLYAIGEIALVCDRDFDCLADQ